MAQISMNLTDITVTPIHKAFDEVCERAAQRGVRVTGSELIGVVPLACMLDAGKYFLNKQKRSTGIPDEEIIEVAVRTFGLNELAPFDPKKRIIEYLLQEEEKDQLVDLSLKNLTYITASGVPAPGGGSVSAAVGALGAALGTMVANLSAHKRGWDDRWEEFSASAEKGKMAYLELLTLVDEDTQAFNGIMDALGLPKDSDEQKAIRKKTIQEATLHAIEVPWRVMKIAAEALGLLEEMAKKGNPNSASDVAVGALCLKTAVSGALLNIKINAVELSDASQVEDLLLQALKMEKTTIKRCAQIQKLVLKTINSKP